MPTAGLAVDNGRQAIRVQGLANGNIIGVPWRVALALQADGWVLRQEIIGRKPSPMPESVTNRCTKAHEHVFLLTKGPRYFCDMEAIKEDGRFDPKGVRGYREGVLDNGMKPNEVIGDGKAFTGANKRSVWGIDDHRQLLDWLATNDPALLERFLAEAANVGTVWRMPSSQYSGAHFATFSAEFIEPMILAGTSAAGACERCGAPWNRVVDRKEWGSWTPEGKPPGVACAAAGAGGAGQKFYETWTGPETVGWEPSCRCDAGARPCAVLDPFVGSGTTPATAVALGRWGWGIDLSEEYLLNHAAPRVEEALRRGLRPLEAVGEAARRTEELRAKVAPAAVRVALGRKD